jgi:hypothetical protein
MRTTPFTLIILSLVACTADVHTEPQPEFNEPVIPAEPSPEDLRSSRMRRATAAFDCLVATETNEDSAACANLHRSADAAAAYDLMICGQFYCIDCFDTEFAGAACDSCLARNCGEPLAAVHDGRRAEYTELPRTIQDGVNSCLDVRNAWKRCTSDACRSAWYFSAPAEQRGVFMQWLMTANAECDRRCNPNAPGHDWNLCGICMDGVAYGRRFEDDCRFGRTSSPSHCEGLSGQAFCICVTGNASAC